VDRGKINAEVILSISNKGGCMKNLKIVLELSAFLFLISMITPICSIAESTPPANVISKEKAQDTALKVYAGKVKESDLEFEKNAWIYSFEIVGKDQKVHEINVNALTGNIIESKIETPAMEAKEKKEDLAAAKTAKQKELMEEGKEKEDAGEMVEPKEEQDENKK